MCNVNPFYLSLIVSPQSLHSSVNQTNKKTLLSIGDYIFNTPLHCIIVAHAYIRLFCRINIY